MIIEYGKATGETDGDVIRNGIRNTGSFIKSSFNNCSRSLSNAKHSFSVELWKAKFKGYLCKLKLYDPPSMEYLKYNVTLLGLGSDFIKHGKTMSETILRGYFSYLIELSKMKTFIDKYNCCKGASDWEEVKQQQEAMRNQWMNLGSKTNNKDSIRVIVKNYFEAFTPIMCKLSNAILQYNTDLQKSINTLEQFYTKVLPEITETMLKLIDIVETTQGTSRYMYSYIIENLFLTINSFDDALLAAAPKNDASLSYRSF